MTEELVPESKRDLEKFGDEHYSLMAINGVVKSALQIRNELLNHTTSKDYIGKKDLYPYVPSNYMDDLFKKYYPIHHIEIIQPPEIIANCWVGCSVLIKAYLSPSIWISNPGTACHRITLPQEKNQLIKQRQKTNTPLSSTDIMPTDWCSLSNDFKSALTDAIKNAQSKFGVCADIYQKGIVPQEILDKVKEAFEELANSIPNTMEQLRVRKEWQTYSEKKGNNLLLKFQELQEKYGFFPTT